MATFVFVKPARSIQPTVALQRRSSSANIWTNQRRNRAISPAFNMTEDADRYTLQATLPGIDPHGLEIDLENQILTIKGEFAARELPEDARYHIREQPVGRFERTFRFQIPLDPTAVQADYGQGILTIYLPKADTVKPRRVEVQVVEPITVAS